MKGIKLWNPCKPIKQIWTSSCPWCFWLPSNPSTIWVTFLRFKDICRPNHQVDIEIMPWQDKTGCNEFIIIKTTFTIPTNKSHLSKKKHIHHAPMALSLLWGPHFWMFFNPTKAALVRLESSVDTAPNAPNAAASLGQLNCNLDGLQRANGRFDEVVGVYSWVGYLPSMPCHSNDSNDVISAILLPFFPKEIWKKLYCRPKVLPRLVSQKTQPFVSCGELGCVKRTSGSGKLWHDLA